MLIISSIFFATDNKWKSEPNAPINWKLNGKSFLPRKNGIDITGEPERLKGDVNLVNTGAIGFLFFLKITWSSEIFGGFIVFGILNRIFSSYYIAKGNYIISTIGDNYLFPILIIFLLKLLALLLRMI